MNTPPRPIRISMPPGAPGRGRPPPVQIPNRATRTLGMNFNNARTDPQVQMNPGGSPGPGSRTGGRRKSRKTRKGRKSRKTRKGCK